MFLEAEPGLKAAGLLVNVKRAEGSRGYGHASLTSDYYESDKDTHTHTLTCFWVPSDSYIPWNSFLSLLESVCVCV